MRCWEMVWKYRSWAYCETWIINTTDQNNQQQSWWTTRLRASLYMSLFKKKGLYVQDHSSIRTFLPSWGLGRHCEYDWRPSLLQLATRRPFHLITFVSDLSRYSIAVFGRGVCLSISRFTTAIRPMWCSDLSYFDSFVFLSFRAKKFMSHPCWRLGFWENRRDDGMLEQRI